MSISITEALGHALARIAAYRPDFLVISLGVDTFKDDPISHFLLASDDFHRLGFRTFADIVTEYLGPRAGFVLSWSYWLSWSIAVIGDVVVVVGFFQYWYPGTPAWMPAFRTMFLLLGLNMLAVRIFGEVEFWFALIKIAAIVMLIVVATMMIGSAYVSPNGIVASFSHMVEPKAILPHGIGGFFAGFQIAIFSFAGTELIGTTAAAAKDPEESLPKAINTIPFRILLFYILALVCIISVVSWQHVPADRSPFVELFALAGLPAAAGIINFVVLTSAASSANSGVSSGSRMLFGLALLNRAPASFGRLCARGVPVAGLLFSGACMDVLRAGRVFVEYGPQTRIEGDIQQMPKDFPVVDLWRVLAGQAKGRETPEQVTIFATIPRTCSATRGRARHARRCAARPERRVRARRMRRAPWTANASPSRESAPARPPRRPAGSS